jgi:hypothetical protein
MAGRPTSVVPFGGSVGTLAFGLGPFVALEDLALTPGGVLTPSTGAVGSSSARGSGRLGFSGRSRSSLALGGRLGGSRSGEVLRLVCVS